MRRGRFWPAWLTCAALFMCDRARAEPTKAPLTSLGSAFTGEAKQSYERARALFQKGDYQGALEALEQTQRLSPDPRLFWNIAACEQKLGRHAKAIHDVERYLSASASLISADEQRDAHQFLIAARAYVSLVTVTGNVDGTEVTVDGELVGTTPLPKPLVIGEGEHRVRFARSAYKGVERVEKVPGGSELRWVAQLEPEVPSSAGRPLEHGSPPLLSTSPSRLGPVLVGGVGLVTAATGAVLVGITLGEASSIDSECGTTCPPSRWEKYRTLQKTGDVLLIVGAAAVAAGAVWWVLQPRASTSSSGPRARIAPSLGGLVFEGSL